MSDTNRVLFNQSTSPVVISSVASGATGQGSAPVGLDAILYSHTGTAYALGALDYNPVAETGFSGTVADSLGTQPSTPGSTSVEVATSGEVGIVINSADLVDSGNVPNGPMPFVLQWIAPQPLPVFSSSNGGLLASLDLAVPYSESKGQGSSTSSNQIVLYFGLVDQSTGRQLAYGMTLFDSRGSSSPYFGVDNGAGGTGATVCTTPAGTLDKFSTPVPGSASFQGAAWNGTQHFAFQITPASLLAVITAANNENPLASALSTDINDYVLTNVSVDAETEYFGTPNSFGYSASNLSVVQESSALASVSGTEASTQANIEQTSAAGTTTLTLGSADETIQALSATHYFINAGTGLLLFTGGTVSSTVLGGAGASTVLGGQSSLTAIGESGSFTATGGSAGGNVLNAGSGNTTLFGSHDDVLSGGSGNTTIFSGAGSNTVFGGSGTLSNTVIVGSTGNDLVVSGSGLTQVFGGTGSETVWGSNGSTASTAMISGTGNSLLVGGNGSDTMWAGTGSDTMVGGSGNELMIAGVAATRIFAGSGSNTIFGGLDGTFIDTGSGSALVDLSQQSSSPDMVEFGQGNSTVFGGASPDIYSFIAGQTSGNVVLSDFRPGTDHLLLQGFDSVQALAGAQSSALATTIDLGTTHVTLIGISGASANLFA